MRDDLLVCTIEKDSPIPRYAVVLPGSLTEEILNGVHDSPFAGHSGVTRTVDRICECF